MQQVVAELTDELIQKEQTHKELLQQVATLTQTLETTERMLHEVISKERKHRRSLGDAVDAKRDAQAKLSPVQAPPFHMRARGRHRPSA